MRILKLIYLYCPNCFRSVALNDRLDSAILACPKCNRQINNDIKRVDKIIWAE